MKAFIFRAITLLLILSLVLPLSACAGSALSSVTVGGRTFEALGGSRPKQLRVTENGKTVWKERVKTDSTVGEMNGSYGLSVLDLNFDGYADIKLVSHREGEVLSNLCYLYDPNTGEYLLSQGLSELCNVMPDPTQKTVLSFAHTRTDFPAFDDTPASYRTCDTATAYYWKNGALIPYRRISLTYDSEHDRYVLSVSDYAEELYEFLDPDDTWLTPEEYASTDLSFLYYFR